MLRHCVTVTGGEDERCLLSLADVLAALRQYRDAAATYTTVMSLREKYEPLDSTVTDERVAFLAAGNYIMAGDIPDAETVVTRLKTLNPESPLLPGLEEKIASVKR